MAGKRLNCLVSISDAITICDQDNMMHGMGHYLMADGTEVTGLFAEDEFVE